MRFKTVLSMVLALLLGLMGISFAQTEPNPELPLTYAIQSGDTLNTIAQKYLTSTEVVTELLELNPDVSSNRLRVDQKLSIPRRLLRYDNTTALISYLRCDSPITLLNTGKPLVVGSIVSPDDVVNVPPMCEMNLKFNDQSVVRMPSGGTIKITTLRINALQKTPEVKLDLLDGRMELKITKRAPNDGGFEVRTPTSVAGVRGTEFRVGYDQDSGAGQVEVSSGLVAARGAQDKTSAPVSAQRGVAIAKAGRAGDVEDLPGPVPFLTAQTQQQPNWLLLVFGKVTNARKYLLSKTASANVSSNEPAEAYNQPQFLAQDLKTKATFLEWTGKTASGLSGDARKYGVCLSKTGAEPLRCDVVFDLHGMRDVRLSLDRIGQNGQQILNEVKPSAKIVEAIVTGLPAGRYQWEIDYKAGDSPGAQQKGEFELVVVNR